ncbi:MAG: aspartate dehydrogenase [Clostridia bacterium]|nr:aspartate dehydrogenase [Clostridia bacterium]
MLFRKPKGPGYDPEHAFPAVRKSICTGEAVAGFVDRATGRFSEVVLIRTPRDLEDFRRQYGIEGSIKTIY